MTDKYRAWMAKQLAKKKPVFLESDECGEDVSDEQWERDKMDSIIRESELEGGL